MPKQYKQKTTPRNMGLLYPTKYDFNRSLDKWVIKPFIWLFAIIVMIVCFTYYKGKERAIKQEQINKQQGYGTLK